MQFEKQTEEFINKLKNFDKTLLKRKIFNPWADFDETDIDKNAPKIRCENLKKYLTDKKDADYILIAESPSFGARYTGIAMTSEKVVFQNNLNYLLTSLKSTQNKPVYELTAKKVWDEILKSKKKFVLWNAFAFNIVEKDKKWFENPDKQELIANISLLNSFSQLFPKAKIIAVGETAKKALTLLNCKDFECVRHPSNDFKKEFPKQIEKYL